MLNILKTFFNKHTPFLKGGTTATVIYYYTPINKENQELDLSWLDIRKAKRQAKIKELSLQYAKEIVNKYKTVEVANLKKQQPNRKSNAGFTVFEELQTLENYGDTVTKPLKITIKKGDIL